MAAPAIEHAARRARGGRRVRSPSPPLGRGRPSSSDQASLTLSAGRRTASSSDQEAHMYNVLLASHLTAPPPPRARRRQTPSSATCAHGVDGACLMDIKMGIHYATANPRPDTGPHLEPARACWRMDKIDPQVGDSQAKASRRSWWRSCSRCRWARRLALATHADLARDAPLGAPAIRLLALRAPPTPARGLPLDARLDRGTTRAVAGHEGAATGGFVISAWTNPACAGASGSPEPRAAAARDAAIASCAAHVALAVRRGAAAARVEATRGIRRRERRGGRAPQGQVLARRALCEARAAAAEASLAMAAAGERSRATSHGRLAAVDAGGGGQVHRPSTA